MEECNKVSLVVETGDAYIEFDGDATTSSMYVPADEGYFDDNVYIGTKISVIRATSTNVRVRGIIWGGNQCPYQLAGKIYLQENHN